MTRLLFICFFMLLAGPYTIGMSQAATPELFDHAPQPSIRADAVNMLDSVSSWISGSPSASELLTPDQAFQVSIYLKDANTLIAKLKPAKDYYFYRSRLQFLVVDTPGISVSNVNLPPGDMKEDPTFGLEEVYYHPVEATIKLHRQDTGGDTLKLRVSYQGCNEPLGVCYPPNEKIFSFSLIDFSPSNNATETFPMLSTASQIKVEGSQSVIGNTTDSDGIRHLFEQRNFWLVIAAFLGLGLLLAFTPCMLPMFPILSGIIVGQGHAVTRKRAFLLSLVYVMAMAITYALAGIAAGLAGTLLSSYLQNPWVLGGFVLIFVSLALSMFGLYELRLPIAIQTYLSRLSARNKGGQFVGVFLMGMLSALIVSPCVAVPLAGALLYIGQTHDVMLGGIALFALAIGMGIPLLIIGTVFGACLPKSGIWMHSVQRFFGVVLLAVAIYIISPVIPVLLQMLLWACLLIVWAIYLHALDPLPHDTNGQRRLWKGAGVILLIVGGALLVGALSGGRDPLQPLAGIRLGDTRPKPEMQFHTIKNLAELDAQLQAAQGKYVMLDFWAEWCVSCKEMDRFTFSNAKVQDRLQNVLLLKADVTANSLEDQALLKRFSLFGPPGIIFFDKQGNEISHRIIGFVKSDDFIKRLNAILK